MSASLLFDREEDDLTLDMVRSLDAIAWRAWPGGSVRVLIVGYANEHQVLTENLALAERRGRAIVKHLVSRGVDRRQVVVTAREASRDDPEGARCDVEVLEPIGRPES
jgi:outer membrane protein OmpA-like peptidoglycan-associated protein